ncbi:chemotaxis protein [Pseudomonas jilinensis]|uniref:Chemotaxis protein n=1 Tax=Pseudomonas jilinensis TaxID=2078689 RepID=A0A396S0U6_9PSED|nr:chemotaxis protein [Pseudomonas jilinensis]RHW21292.1 chemotaxis protein [Pseudomonas jilinensis]
MPLPLIIGAAALATAAYGAKKGYDGYQKHSEADEIVKSAQHRYDRKKSIFDDQEKETTHALEMLGRRQLDIGKNLGEFKTLADKLLQQLNADRQNKLEIHIPRHELQRIENYSYTAVGVLGSAAGAGLAGAAAGFAVYGGVMTLGAASTGTAISSLAGAAATKATLAAIGGGSLATGGLGIAGGTAILGAAVAAPVLAIAGWAYNSHGEEALRNAHKASREVDAAVEKLARAVKQLAATESYARKIKLTLLSIFDQFSLYFDSLKDIDNFLEDVKGRNVDIDAALSSFNDEIIRIIENGFALATILVDVITTPLFKAKKEGAEIVKDQNGLPIMETDADGSMILNELELDKSLFEADGRASAIESA